MIVPSGLPPDLRTSLQLPILEVEDSLEWNYIRRISHPDYMSLAAEASGHIQNSFADNFATTWRI
jgi:hypothetical protein